MRASVVATAVSAAMSVTAMWGIAGAAGSSATSPPLTCQGAEPTIFATADGQHLVGTDHSDTMDANGFRDVTIDGLGGGDSICGGPGDDVLNGGDGADLLYDGGGNDRLDGGAGNDLVSGGPGTNTFVGGPGTDVLRFDNGAAQDFAEGVTIDAATGTTRHEGPVGQQADRFTGFEEYTGGLHATRFIGSSGPDSFYGPSPGNEVSGGAGDDRLVSDGGSVDAGTGNDSVDLQSLGVVDAGPGNDHVTVRANNPYDDEDPVGLITVSGGAGADTVWTVAAGAAEGQPLSSLPGLDVMFHGGSGIDTLVLRGLSGPRATMHADLARRIATSPGFSRPLGQVRWTSDVNRFAGSAYHDRFTGSVHGDHVDGRGGRDVIHGYGGNDVLVGGAGRDYVNGGEGRDACSGEHKVRCERRP